MSKELNLSPMVKDSDYRFLMALIYGEGGCGKSYLSCTISQTINSVEVQDYNGIPVISKGLCFDIEDGLHSVPKKARPTIIDSKFKIGQEIRTLIAKPCKSYEHFVGMYEFLRKHHAYRESAKIKELKTLQDNYFGVKINEIWLFDGLIIDSLTVLQRYCIYHIKKIDVDNMDLKTAPPKADFDVWDKTLSLITQTMDLMRILPMHIVMTCQLTNGENENKEQLYRPFLQGSIKFTIASPFDVVAKMDVDVSKDGIVSREVALLPTRGRHVAKHRFPSFKGAKLPMNELKDSKGNIVQPRLSLTFDTMVKLKNEEF